MVKTTVSIEGMACAMCESHVKDTLRRELPVVRVKASYKHGRAVIESRDSLSEEAIREAIAATGYRVTAIVATPFAYRGLRALLRRR